MTSFLLAAAIAYSCAVVGGWLMHVARRFAGFTCFLTIAAIVPCLLLVPAERTILRGFAALFSTDAMLKVVDFLRHIRRKDRGPVSLAEFYRSLLPFPLMLVVLEQRQRRRSEPPKIPWEVVQAILAALCFAIGSGILYGANQIPAVQKYFLLDHAVKLAIVVILVESASQCLHRLERLAGYNTLPPMLNILASRTVGEFWSRWNTRIHAFLRYNVFAQVGGVRAPVRGIILSFFWSAVLHEVMIGLAKSRFDGYQFTFFMMQIPPVLLSRRFDRFARHHGWLGKAAIHLSTISWIAVTSILFFDAIDRVFPFFYASTPWLP
jgi:hypothetical protein